MIGASGGRGDASAAARFSAHLALEQIRELGERPDALAIVVAVQVADVEQHGAEAGGAGPDDVGVEEVADVERRLGTPADALEGAVKDARVGLLDALLGGVDHE